MEKKLKLTQYKIQILQEIKVIDFPKKIEVLPEDSKFTWNNINFLVKLIMSVIRNHYSTQWKNKISITAGFGQQKILDSFKNTSEICQM